MRPGDRDTLIAMGVTGAIVLLFGLGAGSIASKTGTSITVYPIGPGEFGYTISSGDTFVHSERGFADEKTAFATAQAYVAANINPKLPGS